MRERERVAVAEQDPRLDRSADPVRLDARLEQELDRRLERRGCDRHGRLPGGSSARMRPTSVSPRQDGVPAPGAG